MTQVGSVEVLHWGRHDSHLPFLGSWQEPEWAIMIFMATGALFPVKEAALKTMKSQLPVSFLSLEGALCQDL